MKGFYCACKRGPDSIGYRAGLFVVRRKEFTKCQNQKDRNFSPASLNSMIIFLKKVLNYGPHPVLSPGGSKDHRFCSLHFIFSRTSQKNLPRVKFMPYHWFSAETSDGSLLPIRKRPQTRQPALAWKGLPPHGSDLLFQFHSSVEQWTGRVTTARHLSSVHF